MSTEGIPVLHKIWENYITSSDVTHQLVEELKFSIWYLRKKSKDGKGKTVESKTHKM
jgi:hypothetical protein